MKGEIKKRSTRYAKQRDFMRRSKVEVMENELKREAEKIESILSKIKSALCR